MSQMMYMKEVRMDNNISARIFKWPSLPIWYEIRLMTVSKRCSERFERSHKCIYAHDGADTLHKQRAS